MTKLYIPEDIYKTLQIWANSVPGEIGGLGRVKIVDKNFVVEKVWVLKQKAHSSECELDDVAIALLIDDLINKGENNILNFSWHSHAHMKTFFSTLDATMIEKWPGDWLVSLVINKSMEMTAKFDTIFSVPEEIAFFYTKKTGFELTPEVAWNSLPNEEELKQEAKSKVTQQSQVVVCNTSRWDNQATKKWNSPVTDSKKNNFDSDIPEGVGEFLECVNYCECITCVGGKCSDEDLKKLCEEEDDKPINSMTDGQYNRFMLGESEDEYEKYMRGGYGY